MVSLPRVSCHVFCQAALLGKVFGALWTLEPRACVLRLVLLQVSLVCEFFRAELTSIPDIPVSLHVSIQVPFEGEIFEALAARIPLPSFQLVFHFDIQIVCWVCFLFQTRC